MRLGIPSIALLTLVACSDGPSGSEVADDVGPADVVDAVGPDAEADATVPGGHDSGDGGATDAGTSGDADGGVMDAGDAAGPPEPVRVLTFDAVGEADSSPRFLIHDARGRLIEEIQPRPPVELDVPSGGSVTWVIDDDFDTEVSFQTILGVEPGDDLVFGLAPARRSVREARLRFEPLPDYTFFDVDFGCFHRTRPDPPLTELQVRLNGPACTDASSVLVRATGVGLEPRYTWLENVPTPLGTNTATVVTMPAWRAPDAHITLEAEGITEPTILGRTDLQVAFGSGTPLGSIPGVGDPNDATLREFAFPAEAEAVWLNAVLVDRATNRERRARKRLDRGAPRITVNGERDFLPRPDVLQLIPGRGDMRVDWTPTPSETPDAYRIEIYWPPIDPFGNRDFGRLFPHWTIITPGTMTSVRTPEVPARFREFASYEFLVGSDVGVIAWDGHDYADVKRRLGTDWRSSFSWINRRLDGEYRLTP